MGVDKRFGYLSRKNITLGENYRRTFRKDSLLNLAASISRVGLIKPILVMKKNGTCTVIAGQRRYLACELAQLERVPCMIYPKISEEEILKIQLAENTQEKIASHHIAGSRWELYKAQLAKKGMMPLKELDNCKAYWDIPAGVRKKYCMDDFADYLGKDRKTVRRAFRLQRLHPGIAYELEKGSIRYSIASEIARIPDQKQQMAFYKGMKEGRHRDIKKLVDEVLEEFRQIEAGEFELKSARPKKLVPFEKDARIYLADSSRFFIALSEALSSVPNYFSQDKLKKNLEQPIKDTTIALDGVMRELERHGYRQQKERRNLREEILNGRLKLDLKSREYKEPQPVTEIRLDLIVDDTTQPRKIFYSESIKSLAESIKEVGLLEPILVRPIGSGTYCVVVGHRRSRAARLAGLEKIEALIAEDISLEEARILQYEEDLFEEDRPAERAEAIYKIYTARKKRNPKFTLKALQEEMKITSKVLKKALDYCTLDDKTKLLEQRGMLSYDVAVELLATKEDERLGWAMLASINGWGARKTRDAVKSYAEDKKNYSNALFDDYEQSAKEIFFNMLVRDVSHRLLNSARWLKTVQSMKDIYKEPLFAETVFKYVKALQMLKSA